MTRLTFTREPAWRRRRAFLGRTYPAAVVVAAVVTLLALAPWACRAADQPAAAQATKAAQPNPVFTNDHYTAVVDASHGGLLQSLKSAATGETLVEGMFIYTDYGVYPTRGMVTSNAEGSVESFAQRREGDATVTVAEGKLVGEPAQGQPPIRYRAELRFDKSATIHVDVTLRPELNLTGCRGFLSLAWACPAMARWEVRTIDGLLRHLYRPGEETGRSFSHQLPLDPLRPLIALGTQHGAELRIEHLKWSGVPLFTGPAIDHQSVFLCWLDGTARDLKAGQDSNLQFDLVVGRGR